MSSIAPVRIPVPHRSQLRVALRDAAKAAYCQMYYWGRDVLHPDGNLLVRFGFERIAKSSKEGTSRYRLAWQEGIIELHGFCAGWYPDSGGGICYDRKHESWRLWDSGDLPDPAGLVRREVNFSQDNGRLPDLLQRSARFLTWVLTYERWSMAQWGVEARRGHHRDFTRLLSRKRWLPPEPSLNWLAAYAADPSKAPRPRSLTQTAVALPRFA